MEKGLSDFLFKMLVKDPTNRPTLFELSKDDWINDGHETNLSEDLI